MNPSPKVSVVILNWNGRHYMERFLPVLLSSTGDDAEVVVADNGSTDDSIEFLEKNFPAVRLIRFATNMGFAKGYNEALKLVQSTYYVLLNSDVEVTGNWLSPMIDLLDADPSIAACQPKILSYHNNDLFEYAGAAGGWMDMYGYPFAKGRVFDYIEEDKGQYNDASPVFWASGAALFIRSHIFHDIGGFDEYFFAHQEEIDLCWRIQLAGHQIYACPSSIVYHVGGGTLPRGNSLKTYLNFRNNRIMLSKNLPLSRKIWIVPVRNFLDAVSALKGLFSGDAGYFVAICKAEAAFIKWWLFHKKKSVFPRSRKGKLLGYLRKNIAWMHFVRKKTTFPEIVGKSG